MLGKNMTPPIKSRMLLTCCDMDPGVFGKFVYLNDEKSSMTPFFSQKCHLSRALVVLFCNLKLGGVNHLISLVLKLV